MENSKQNTCRKSRELKRVAIIGNPNSGKSTIFNNLTGLNQKVRNWSGVTVEKYEGEFTYKDEKFHIVDLPGTYGLYSLSTDEKVARRFLIEEKPDAVIVVVDSTNIEKHLFLSIETLEMGHNAVLCLNMTDLANEKGLIIDEKTLSKILKIPFIKTIGNKNIGTEDLKEAIYQVVKNKEEKF